MTDNTEEMLDRAQQTLRARRWDEAHRELLGAVEGLRTEGGKRLAEALRSLAEVERKLSDGANARAHYEQAVSILRNCAAPLKLAHTIRHLGDVHHETGCPDMARPCYEEALALYRRHADAAPLDVANAIRSMAILQQEAGKRELARALWNEAREIYAAEHIEAGVAECDTRLRQLADDAQE